MKVKVDIKIYDDVTIFVIYKGFSCHVKIYNYSTLEVVEHHLIGIKYSAFKWAIRKCKEWGWI